jgi:cyclohexanone monooxygenase
MSQAAARGTVPDATDVVVVGAGFAGLYMLHRLRNQGLSAIAFEAGEDVGGTWYWNRYPGARCDVESVQYSYGFSNEIQQEWHWPELYSAQPDILRYARFVAEKLDLRRDIRFSTRVTEAHFNETTRRWTVRTDQGDEVSARYCVMATGCLSTTQLPDFPGLEGFRGATYHTGHWPHGGVDFTGQRVAVIGTGSSAIQSIPEIAKQAAHLTIFQRTPNFSLPSRNAAMPAEYEQDWKTDYPARRAAQRWTMKGVVGAPAERSALEVSAEERTSVFEERWKLGGAALMTSFTDLLTVKQANDHVAEFVRSKIRQMVQNPATAEALLPTSYPIGTKRICIDSAYFETYNRPNVTLVDIRTTAIDRITEHGVVANGTEHEVDAIVFATGFDAMTGTLTRINIQGRGGQTLKQKWEAGPLTYLGLMTAGFPNLFMVTGPGSPSVLSNMIVSIEQHVEWISDCLTAVATRQGDCIEATPQAEQNWVQHVAEAADRTLFPLANSWYMGANIPGKPRVILPYVAGVGPYRKICDEIVADNYRGFSITGAEARAAAE